MKSHLSAMKCIWNNKKTCFVLMLSLALTFMAMYVVAFILSSTIESTKTVCLELPKRITYLQLGPESLGLREEDYADEAAYSEAYRVAREDFLAKVGQHEGVKKAYFTQVLRATYNSVIGTVGYEFPLVDPEEVPVITEHLGARLIEGRMPRGDGEILVDSILMKNQEMKIGDWYMEKSYGQVFKVVGVLESDNMAIVGTPMGYCNNGWYMVLLVDEEWSDFSRLAEEFGIVPGELDIVDDVEDYRDFYQKEVVDVIQSVIDAIIAVVMIFLVIAMIVAYVSFMRNRVNEYCLYASLGYSRREIYGMIMREMLIMFGIGILAGAVLSLIVMVVFQMVILEPRGLFSTWFMPGQILKILAAFTVSIGLLQIPVLVSVHKIKTIDMMED